GKALVQGRDERIVQICHTAPWEHGPALELKERGIQRDDHCCAMMGYLPPGWISEYLGRSVQQAFFVCKEGIQLVELLDHRCYVKALRKLWMEFGLCC